MQLFVYQLNIRIYHNHALGLLARCPGVHGEDFLKIAPNLLIFYSILWPLGGLGRTELVMIMTLNLVLNFDSDKNVYA